MRPDKPRPTLADYTAIALSPLLIMALIGSLVWFIVAILYTGDFTERLRWVLFWVVFGLVLVARISMEYGISDRAPLYGIVLALAFLLWGIDRIDPAAAGAYAFRPLLLPGLVLLWPLVAVRWAILARRGQ